MEKSKSIIGKFNFYIANGKDEGKAIEQIKELIETTTDIKNVKWYDTVYGEMKFSGELNNKEVKFNWNYFNGNITRLSA